MKDPKNVNSDGLAAKVVCYHILKCGILLVLHPVYGWLLVYSGVAVDCYLLLYKVLQNQLLPLCWNRWYSIVKFSYFLGIM